MLRIEDKTTIEKMFRVEDISASPTVVLPEHITGQENCDNKEEEISDFNQISEPSSHNQKSPRNRQNNSQYPEKIEHLQILTTPDDPELAELENYLAETPMSSACETPMSEINWFEKKKPSTPLNFQNSNNDLSPMDFLESLFAEWPNFELDQEIIETVLKTSNSVNEAVTFLIEMANENQNQLMESDDHHGGLLEDMQNYEFEEAKQQKKKKKRKLLQRKIPKDEAIQNLSEIFPHIDPSTIEAVLITVDYDLQLAFNTLVLNSEAEQPENTEKKAKNPEKSKILSKNSKFKKRNDLIGGGEITWTGNVNEDFLDKHSVSNIQKLIPYVSKDAISNAIKNQNQKKEKIEKIDENDEELIEDLKKNYPKIKIEIVSANSKKTKKFVPNYFKNEEKTKTKDKKIEEKDKKTKEYFEVLKKLSEKSESLRDEFFKLSVIEYVNGNLERAFELAKKGKQANSIFEDYSNKFKNDSKFLANPAENSNTNFVENNLKLNPLFVIDFHGFFVVDAIRALQRHLTLVKKLRIHKLTVITGKGNHSVGGKSKLKPAILEFLTKKMNEENLILNFKIFEGGIKIIFDW